MICQYCHAHCNPGDETCWLCFKRLPVSEAPTEVTPAVVSRAGSATDVSRTDAAAETARAATDSSSFSLMSLMLLITLSAVCFGAITAAPGLGILLCVLATPALIRTVVVSMKRKGQGTAVSPQQKVALFAASMAAVMAAGVAAITVFFGTCVAVCFGAIALEGSAASGQSMEFVVFGGLGLGALAGLGVAGLVLKLLWRKR